MAKSEYRPIRCARPLNPAFSVCAILLDRSNGFASSSRDITTWFGLFGCFCADFSWVEL